MGSVKIVRASAGSGKTYQLSYEYVKRVMTNPDLYRSILAVTFTNKATEEMKRRIIREINDLANGHDGAGRPAAFAGALEQELGFSPETVMSRARRIRTRILHDYSHFTILTIDKFFQRIIRAFIRELGVETDFTLELQTDSVLGSAADRLIEDTLANDELRRWIIRFVEEQIADGRSWNIKGEITDLGREIFKDQYRSLGSSSNTKEAIQKIINAAVATVEKNGARMKSLAQQAVSAIADYGLTAEDFPYGKSGFASYFYTVASGDFWSGYGKRVADARDDEQRWYTAKMLKRSDVSFPAVTAALQPLLQQICTIYDENYGFANTTALLRENFRTYAMLSDLSGYVRETCDKRNVMLISETNHIINKLIDGNDTPFIFEKVGNNFSHYMIDEFQDTSLSQWNNFYPLLTNALSQSDESPVLIVGDVKQSIYRWRGGDWEILGDRINRSFHSIEELTLDKNYRSKGLIVDFNNRLISAAVSNDNAVLDAQVDEARARGLIGAELGDQLRGMLTKAYAGSEQQVARTRYAADGHVKIVLYDRATDDGEDPHAGYIVRQIEELQQRGFRPSDIAVLVRYNFEAVQVANILLEYKSTHPDSPYCYDVVTQEALIISSSPVIGFVTACFRLAANLSDSISRAIYRKFLGGAVNEGLTEAETAFIASLRLVSLEEAFEQLVLEYRLDNEPRNVAYLQAYHEQLLSFANTRISDIPLFLQWWDESGSGESINLPGGQDAVTIITIHKAKGLQYPAVIMPYADWDMTPKSKTLLWADTETEPFSALGRMPVRFKKAIADSYFAPHYYKELVYTHVDNVNMLYVALTRAEEELCLMMPRSKKTDGSRVSDLILRSMELTDDAVSVGNLQGRTLEEKDAICYEFGLPVHKEPDPGDEARCTYPADSYPTFRFDGKIRLHRASDRYVTDSGEPVLSPRNYGRVMHKVFESITTADQIEPTLRQFLFEGIISPADSEKIRGMIVAAFSDPLIRSWFDGDWEVVRNENDIIVPAHTASLRRPDRVLIKGDRVVVVDYKFGQKENKYYARQIGGYMSLIREMGFTNVEGYIWYVEMDKVVPIEA